MSYNTSAYSEFALAEGSPEACNQFQWTNRTNKFIEPGRYGKGAATSSPGRQSCAAQPVYTAGAIPEIITGKPKVDTKTLLEAARGTETYPSPCARPRRIKSRQQKRKSCAD